MVIIEYLDYEEDVYDIEVEDLHNFYANGILVHNCNLISVVFTNLVNKSDEFFKEVCEYAVFALDSSIDGGTSPVLEADNLSQLLRNIGVGAVGVADYMAYNNKLYDSEDGLNFLEKTVEKMSYFCYTASVELAKEYGAYPMFKPENYDKILGKDPELLNKLSLNGFDWVQLRKDIIEFGIRNFYLLAFAPNSTTGILMGASASYLPVYNKEMVQTLGDMSLPILPRYINKKYWGYKTKFQYHPKAIINATSVIQKWVDTGLSMELNISPEICKINEISDAIIEGFLDGDLKTVYYSMTVDGACTDCGN
jgi:ribonucleoside-diphosphate reductase alpha chain